MITDWYRLFDYSYRQEKLEYTDFYNVTFLADFGNFKSNEKYNVIRVFDRGEDFTIEVRDVNGRIVKAQDYKVVPK